MASARKTGVNENISTYDSGGGQDYSSLSAWESDTDYDLVTAEISEVLECYAGLHDDSIIVAGATSNTSYFRIIRPALGEGHEGIPLNDGSCAAFRKTVSVSMFDIEERFSLQDIVCSLNINSSTNPSCVWARYGNIDLVGILVHDCANAGSGTVHSIITEGNSGDTINVIDCLSINNAERPGFEGNSPSGAETNFYNCTSYGNIYGYNASGAGTHNAINCIAESNTTNWVGSWDVKTYYTDDDGVVFVDSGNDNFLLDTTDTAAIEQGTDLSAYFDDDILGNERLGTWDIGFYEYPKILQISVYSSPVVIDVTSSGIWNSPLGIDNISVGEYVYGTVPFLNTSIIDSIVLAEYVVVEATEVKSITTYSSVHIMEYVNVFISGYLINGEIDITCEPLDLIIEVEAA